MVETREGQEKERLIQELSKTYARSYLEYLDIRVVPNRIGGRKAAAEDYALKRIPATWRWDWKSIMWVVWGGVTFLYAYYLGGAVSTGFGMPAFIISALVSLAWMIFPSIWFLYKGAIEGVSADLLSRGSFGYGGSAFSTLIYVFLWIYYFAAEGEIMASALNSFVPVVPLWAWEIVVAAIFIPLTIYGMVFLSRFQFITWFLWLPLIVATNYLVLFGNYPGFTHLPLAQMLTYQPHGVPFNYTTVNEAIAAGFGLFVLWPLWAMDYTRFLRLDQLRKAILIWIPYTFVPWLDYFLGGFLALITHNPNIGVYSVTVLGIGGVILSIITQLRINVENVYSGSLSYSNFFSRALHWVPGRRFWVYVFIISALIAMEINILGYATIISTFFTIWLGAWITVMFVDYTITRKILKIPRYAEFRRAYLANINVPNFLAMWIPILINIPSFLQISGVIPSEPSLGPSWYEASTWWLTIVESAILAIVFPVLWSRFKSPNKIWFAREIVPKPIPENELVNEEYVCPVCKQRNHVTDYVWCPWYENGIYIDSYCCMGTNCGNYCQHSLKPKGMPIPTKPPHGFIDMELTASKNK